MKALNVYGSGLFSRGRKNPRKHRDRFGIIAEILEVAKGSTLKTPIMYKANLSFAQLEEYLALLLGLDLIESGDNEDKIFYKTTVNGLKFIENYKEIAALLEQNIYERTVHKR